MTGVMIKSILILMIILGPTLHLNAGCYISRTFVHPTYYQPVVQEVQVKKVVAVEYLALPVVVPAYAVGYNQPSTVIPTPAIAPAPSSCETKLTEVSAKLAALEARIEAALTAEAPSSLPPGAQGAGRPKVKTLVSKCASCHDSTVATTKGGKLVLFDKGAATSWTNEVVGKVLREVSSGRMPKGGKLTSDEFTAIAQEIFDLNSK